LSIVEISRHFFYIFLSNISYFSLIMAKKYDWMIWVGAAIAAFIAYSYITSQKAGPAPMAMPMGTEENDDPSFKQANRASGCGCGH
jgi:hypothetical protein